MTQIQPAGWYRDPTSTYEYRYWDGGGWTERVSTGGTSGTDPNPLDPTVAITPPAPGTAAPKQPAAPPSVQVTQSGGGGSSFGTIIGVVFAVVAVVVLIVVLVALAGDDDSSSDTEVPAIETPVETEAPAPTEAP